MQLRKPLSLILIAILMFSSAVVLLPAETALAHEGDDKMDEGVAFLVRIENVSGDSDLPTPFAPGVWVLHSEPGPLFIEGEADKGYGLEALAEDGDPRDLATKYPPGQPPVSPRLMRPKLPNILVLTTPTTAATRAGTAVIDGETGHRLEMFDPKTRPATVIWDTEALLTAPADLCVSASGSLFSGVISALQGPSVNAMAVADLLASLGLLVENLPMARKDATDGAARVNLCAASFMYNRAWDTGASGSALGVVTALAHSLDTRYPDCSHGAAYSILTAPGMRFNRDSNVAGQARVADALGVREQGADDVDAAESAADAVAGFFEAIGLPVSLRDVGVPADGIREIAEDAMTDFGLHRNVRPVQGVEELEAVLRAAW